MAPAVTLASALKATRTLPQVVTKVLTARQETTTVVTDGTTSGGSVLSGGAIAGIVIGSIAGFLLLWWIVRSCCVMGHPERWGRGDRYEPPLAREKLPPVAPYGGRSRSRSHHHHHHSRSPRRVEVVQPVAYASRGRSPRAPPAAYYAGRASADERRRSSDARRYRY
ncbi:hypothetical protein GGS24DRAFT_449635 [Hypoxylon argillaceum]|nr:hypothetical protein GGS24DRAFT_449635 [Hypoxylon argillaceum]